MKPSTVWHGHSTRPSLPAWNSEEGQRSLVGARPLHLLLQDRSVAQKPHWGFHCCAAQTRVSLGRQSRLIMQTTKNRKFPVGNALLYISLSYVDFCRVRPAGRTLFLFYALIFPAQHLPDGSNHSTVSYRFHSVPPR